MESERLSVMKTTLNGNPPRKPMINVMENTSNNSLHQRSFQQNNNNNNNKRNDQQTFSCREDTVDDSDQISVFDAENYFNENTDDDDQRHNKQNRLSSTSGVVSAPAAAAAPPEIFLQMRSCEFSRLSSVSSSVNNYHRHHSFHATPTASSEASWNSQTGLLTNPPGSIAVSMRNLNQLQLVPNNTNHKKSGSSGGGRSLLGRIQYCPCTGKKSVQVLDDHTTSTAWPSSSTPRSSGYQIKSQKSSISHDDKGQLAKQNHHFSLQWDPPETTIRLEPIKSQKNPNLVVETRRFSSQNRFMSELIAPTHHRHDGAGTGFSFPILNQPSKMGIIPTAASYMEDPPRDSLEVFQPPEEPISGRDRRGLGFPASPISRLTGKDMDDAGSDASSDLFEIESFSTSQASSSYHQMYRRRDSLDEATTFNTRRVHGGGGGGGLYCRRRSLDELETPSVAVTETDCYEPSEASIAWSVTTAEGFDRGSVANLSVSASDVDEVGINGGGDGRIRRSAAGGNGLMLLSCRSEKAVSVGPRVVGGGGGGHGILNKPPLGRPASARLSLAFAT